MRRASRDLEARILVGRTTLWSPCSPPVRRRSLGRCNSAGGAGCSRRGRLAFQASAFNANKVQARPACLGATSDPTSICRRFCQVGQRCAGSRKRGPGLVLWGRRKAGGVSCNDARSARYTAAGYHMTGCSSGTESPVCSRAWPAGAGAHRSAGIIRRAEHVPASRRPFCGPDGVSPASPPSSSTSPRQFVGHRDSGDVGVRSGRVWSPVPGPCRGAGGDRAVGEALGLDTGVRASWSRCGGS